MNSHGTTPPRHVLSGDCLHDAIRDGTNVHGKENGKPHEERNAEQQNATKGRAYDEAVYSMEVHEMKDGKLTKIRGYMVGGEFIATSKGRTTLHEQEGFYPQRQVHRALRRYYKRYTVREALELGGMGLFTNRDIKANDLIGIYAGKVTDKGGGGVCHGHWWNTGRRPAGRKRTFDDDGENQ
jgi:hypothetical protein